MHRLQHMLNKNESINQSFWLHCSNQDSYSSNLIQISTLSFVTLKYHFTHILYSSSTIHPFTLTITLCAAKSCHLSNSYGRTEPLAIKIVLELFSRRRTEQGQLFRSYNVRSSSKIYIILCLALIIRQNAKSPTFFYILIIHLLFSN